MMQERAREGKRESGEHPAISSRRPKAGSLVSIVADPRSERHPAQTPMALRARNQRVLLVYAIALVFAGYIWLLYR